ncbi:hypothetical protein [Halovivax gelatinilyticus]|uniref:hypothetical protein n=1 Tax=Halovivax gelatinilyticus TaxID=2961597 RepID=UPI0020CA5BC2|nr:hypothetical protein [Halovivax gelatinilyticus]
MTTQRHADGLAVSADDWIRGGSNRDAYVSPWYVTTIKRRDLDTQQGTLSASIVAEAVDALHSYTAFVE